MADQRALFSEEAVGATHPTKADVINRLALIEHNNDGTHAAVTADTLKLATGAPATPVDDTLYADTIISGWLVWSYSGGVPQIDRDVNVSSLDDDGTGIIGVNFARNLVITTYCVAGAAAVSDVVISTSAKAATEMTMQIETTAGANQDQPGSILTME